MLGYCVKCKQKREMKNTSKTKSKNGREMMRGTCSVCGTKMCKFI